MTPKLKQQDGYTFKIFSNEEERKHIHVVKGDCEAKFWLEPIIELAYNYGFNNKELKKITQIITIYGDNFKSNLQPTSVNVLMINAQGMMLSVLGRDYFLSYNRVPWLREARVSSALNVRMCGHDAIEWPELDIDLELESLRHPERYPLIMKRTPLDVL